MGTWDIKPWDNDSAADWFGDIFDKTNLRNHVRHTLENGDIEDEYEEIRAAASVVIALGHIYVWPIDHLDDDLKLAAEKLKQIVNGPLSGETDFIELINKEISVLESRIINKNQDEKDAKKPWWKLW